MENMSFQLMVENKTFSEVTGKFVCPLEPVTSEK